MKGIVFPRLILPPSLQRDISYLFKEISEVLEKILPVYTRAEMKFEFSQEVMVLVVGEVEAVVLEDFAEIRGTHKPSVLAV